MVKRFCLVFCFIVACFLVVACQTGDSSSPKVKDSLTLTLNPSQIVLAQGQVTSIGVLVTNALEAVTLSVNGLPSGLTVDSSSLQLTTTEGSLRFSAADDASLGKAQVTVTASAGSVNTSQTLAVTVLAKAEAKLDNLSSKNLSLQAKLAETTQGSLSFQNTGSSSLAFTASTDASWLSLSDSSGSLNPTETFTLSAQGVCSNELEVLNGNINILSNGGNASIPVSLTCSEEAPTTGTLAVSITGLPAGLNANVVVNSNDSSFSHSFLTSETLTGLEPASYTLLAQEVRDASGTYFPAPESQTLVITVGSTSSASINYVKQEPDKGSLNLNISGLKDGVVANIILSGPSGDIALSSGQLVTGLPVGEYGLRAEDVVPDSATFSADTKAQVVFIKASQTTSLDIIYSCSNVNPPDAVLKAFLVEKIGKAQFNCADLASLTEIDYGFQTVQPPDSEKIRTIEGLQYAFNLESLKLYSHVIASLPNGIFDDMSSLKLIWLFGNRLSETTVPEDVFSKLTQLETLFISSNNFKTLPDVLFSGLGNLSHLSISGNPLTEIDQRLFADLKKLERLGIGGTSLSTLPANLLENLASLIDINIDSGQLTTLPETFFSNNPLLRSIELQNNQLSSLPNSLFANLTNLEYLSLKNNQLSSLNANQFENLTKLESLVLSSNQLTALPNGIFSGLTQLEDIRLEENQLTSLQDNLFNTLSNLRGLDFADNQLSSLAANSFTGLEKLRTLELQNNQLEFIPLNVFEPLSESLDRLDLSYNKLCCFGDSYIFKLNKLRILDLSYNPAIIKIEQALLEGQNLTYLYLEGNSITDITELWKQGPASLIAVELSENCFSPEAVPHAGYLKELRLNFPVTTTPPRTDCDLVFPPDLRQDFFEPRQDWQIRGNGSVTEPEWPFDGELNDYITSTDNGSGSSEIWYFRAPEYFYGDASAYFGLSINVVMRRSASSTRLLFSPDIILQGAGMTLTSTWYEGAPSTTDWTETIMSLKVDDEIGQWMKDGNPASNADLQAVLADLEELWIRGEYTSGGSSDLDRVILFGSF